MTAPTPAAMRKAALADVVRANDRTRVVAGKLRRQARKYRDGADLDAEDWALIERLLAAARNDLEAVRKLAEHMQKEHRP